jgi:predicted GIY-YIG superfamily endonuclease
VIYGSLNVDRLVYFEESHDTDQAIARESEIKQMALRPKVRLIESTNPQWRDLSTQ